MWLLPFDRYYFWVDLSASLKVAWATDSWWPVLKNLMLTQTAHGWNLDFSSVCSQLPPFPLFSTSFVLETWALGRECSETKSHPMCKLFLYQLWEAPPHPWPSRAQSARAHSSMTTDPSCRRKCPSIGNSSEIHSLASGVILANCLGREKLTHVSEIKSRGG